MVEVLPLSRGTVVAEGRGWRRSGQQHLSTTPASERNWLLNYLHTYFPRRPLDDSLLEARLSHDTVAKKVICSGGQVMPDRGQAGGEKGLICKIL